MAKLLTDAEMDAIAAQAPAPQRNWGCLAIIAMSLALDTLIIWAIWQAL